MLLEGGREEAPDLPEDDREREQAAREEGDHERGDERLGDTKGDRLAEVVRKRAVQPVEQVPAKDVREDEAEEDGEHADDEARAQLSEVLDERDLLPGAEPPRKKPHGSSRRCRARAGARLARGLRAPRAGARDDRRPCR